MSKMKEMPQTPLIVFACEHGAAKSILAAAYFNKLANQTGSNFRAVARGTNPDLELSPQTVAGLSKDGLHPTESTPQKLTMADIQNAQRLITFCDLPTEYRQPAFVEHWEGIPSVSESYEQARDAITERIRQFLNG